MINRFQRYKFGICGYLLMGSDKFEGENLNDLEKGLEGRMGSQDEIHP